MHRCLAAVLSLSILPLTISCSPAQPPAPANAAAAVNVAGDELLDTSPDSLAAPDDANDMGAAESQAEHSAAGQ